MEISGDLDAWYVDVDFDVKGDIRLRSTCEKNIKSLLCDPFCSLRGIYSFVRPFGRTRESFLGTNLVTSFLQEAVQHYESLSRLRRTAWFDFI